MASVSHSDHKISRNYEPSTAVSDSPMFTVNDETTVQQLTDLSVFLQDAYDIRIREPSKAPNATFGISRQHLGVPEQSSRLKVGEAGSVGGSVTSELT